MTRTHPLACLLVPFVLASCAGDVDSSVDQESSGARADSLASYNGVVLKTVGEPVRLALTSQNPQYVDSAAVDAEIDAAKLVHVAAKTYEMVPDQPIRLSVNPKLNVQMRIEFRPVGSGEPWHRLRVLAPRYYDDRPATAEYFGNVVIWPRTGEVTIVDAWSGENGAGTDVYSSTEVPFHSNPYARQELEFRAYVVPRYSFWTIEGESEYDFSASLE